MRREREARLQLEKEREDLRRAEAEAKALELAQKKAARKEFRAKHQIRFRLGFGVAFLVLLYSVIQVSIWSKVSPEALASKYFAAVESGDTAVLSDKTLFPNSDPSFQVAPLSVLNTVARPKYGEAKPLVTWHAWSGSADAQDSYGNSIHLVSEDKWKLVYRIRSWKIVTEAPKVVISAKAGLKTSVSTLKIGNYKLDSSSFTSLPKKPLKYVVWPGSMAVRSVGKGFVQDNISESSLTPGETRSIVFSKGKLGLSYSASSSAARAARVEFNSCLQRAFPCGNFFSMSDFSIDTPWIYEDYSVSDSGTSDGCEASGTEFRDAMTAVLSFDCTGTIYRSVTWLIASYYFIPNDYQYDSGSADVSTTVTVRVRYSQTKNKTYVDNVTYE